LPPLAINLFWAFLAEVLVIKFFQSEVFARHFDYDWHNRYEPLNQGFIPFLAVLGASYIYWAARQWVLNKNEFEKMGKTTAELALLKNQVNPHFLFNTLNNLFSMAIERKADDLAESISQLTHLMRYSIYESRTEYVELHREIEYIENYIKLQKLRFSADDAVSIRFNVLGDAQSVRIAPMLLINFVENAFKHGVSLKQPSVISISLSTTEDQIAFTVENTIFRQNKDAHVAHAGFGLEHTRKLLEMQYPHRHQLQITEVDNIFRAALVLKLQKTKVEVMA
jgi:LytS/YehU family sensor histidine kinase